MGLDLMTSSFLGLRDKLHHIAMNYLQSDEDVQDAPVICDDHIDLEPLIRDAIVLALPFQPLCREDCEGLCPECGQAWDELPDDHAHEAPYNPQFDALADLEAQLREAE